MSLIYNEIHLRLNQSIVLGLVVFGIVFNITSIAVFLRPVFNHHVGSYYYSSLAVNSCLYLFTVVLYRVLADGFQIQALADSFALCQAISYVDTFCIGMLHYLTVLLAIDRWSATSADARRKRLNSFQLMPWFVLTATIACAIIAIGAPVAVSFNVDNQSKCSVRTNATFNQVFLIIELVLFVVLAPGLLIVFTKLIKANRKAIGDLPVTVSRCRRMEYHQTNMFFLYTAAHILFILPEWLEYLTPLRLDTYESAILIQTISRIPVYLSFVLPFVWYLLTGREFRRELRKMIPFLNFACIPVQLSDPANNNEQNNAQDKRSP